MTFALILTVGVGLALGILGGGGSILMLPILVHALALDAKAAIAASLLIVASASLVAGAGHAFNGRVAWRVGATFGVASVTMSFIAGYVARVLPAALLLGAFTCVMFATGIAMLRRSSTTPQPSSHPGKALAVGAAVGLVTGSVGAGGGFLVVPALTMFAGLPMSHAVGTSLFIIAFNSLAGFAGYAGHVALPWGQMAALVAVASLSSLAGSLLAGRVPQHSLRRTFGGLVVAMALWVGAQQLHQSGFISLSLDADRTYVVAAVTGAVMLLVMLKMRGQHRAALRNRRHA